MKILGHDTKKFSMMDPGTNLTVFIVGMLVMVLLLFLFF